MPQRTRPPQPKPVHIMVDLETFGTAPGSVIASIGAVVFDPLTGEQKASFYAVIDRASCEAVGLVADPNTLAWWATQSAEAQAALMRGAQPLQDVLRSFSGWWRWVAGATAERGRFWAQGPSFDQSLLDAAYRAIGEPTPWPYNAGRDTRTIYELARVRTDTSTGTYHNALDDARRQAAAVSRGYRRLGLTGSGLLAAFARLMGRL